MEFIDLQRNEMQTSYTGFLGDYAVSKATMIVVSLICLALGIIMAILISRAIVRPINHAVSAATRIAEAIWVPILSSPLKMKREF
jgi:methyl-accepting chemotaxis protein-2 (aspartate sensor receptor)